MFFILRGNAAVLYETQNQESWRFLDAQIGTIAAKQNLRAEIESCRSSRSGRMSRRSQRRKTDSSKSQGMFVTQDEFSGDYQTKRGI